MALSSRTQFGRIVGVGVFAWLMMMPRTSEAQRRGGGARGGRSVGGGAGSIEHVGGARTSSGGGNRLAGGYGGAARTSVNRDFGNTSVDHANLNNANINRANVNNANINRANVNNVNVNRNWNTDIDVDNGWAGHPVARGAAFATGAALTSAAIGSVVYSLPSACSVVVVNGVSYQHCGSTWYEPQFAGTSVSYVVVGSPQ